MVTNNTTIVFHFFVNTLYLVATTDYTALTAPVLVVVYWYVMDR